jgi:hypothetical protein
MKNQFNTLPKRLTSGALRQLLKLEAEQKCRTMPDSYAGFATPTAFIYSDVSMNFSPESFAAIQARPEWKARTRKRHSTFKNGIIEMQSCNSSDARLMNVFCHPSAAANSSLHEKLGIITWETPVFGWKANLPNELRRYPTECDMKIGDTIVEAKLTEKDFTQKCSDVVERYPGFFEIFDAAKLPRDGDEYLHYQLIRNITVAQVYGFRFVLIIDERRKDLKEAFEAVRACVRDEELRSRCGVVGWQDLT